jgi:hypothetical protein
MLNSEFGQVKQKVVSRNQIIFNDGVIYNPSYVAGQQFTTYDITSTNFSVKSLSNASYLSVVLHQNNREQFETYTRTTIAATLLLLGGFISMITRMTNFTLNTYQNFTIDKSMIKKLYSWKQPQAKPKRGKSGQFVDDVEKPRLKIDRLDKN